MSLPEYVCHKRVRAAKIKAIWHVTSHRAALMVLDERGVSPMEVPMDFIEKHNPQPGGYLVMYEDYRSYSPAEAFEAGYTRV